jgi:K+ transporter
MKITAKGIIKSFGLVFGDIGTSPIYTLTVVFLLTKPTEQNIIESSPSSFGPFYTLLP